MKIGDKVNLVTASGEKYIGTVFKIFPKDILTLTIIRPERGITQKYHKVPKLPTNPKTGIAYWTTAVSKEKEKSTVEKVTNTKQAK